MPIGKHTAAVIVAVVGAISTIAGIFLSHNEGKKDGLIEAKRQVTLAVYTFNASTGKELPNVLVKMTGLGVGESRRTDSNGKITFELPERTAGQWTKIHLEADKFESKNEDTQLQSGYKLMEITMIPVVLSDSGPTKPKTALNLQRIFSSGPRISGSGSGFSEWYSLCSDGIPQSATITNVSFLLSGDRRCGGWANCVETERTGNRVCYKFQLQGHNENPPPGQAFSEGILTVNYTQG